jgi:hypothetical protein
MELATTKPSWLLGLTGIKCRMTDMLKRNIENLKSADADAIRWVAPIARWTVWQKDSTSPSLPDVSFVESSLRRKLSSLAKISLHVANDCAGNISGVHLVYASRHGDLSRTTAMLVDLVDEQPLSPTAFSMSVLNAFAGVYSISKNEQLPSTSLSSGESSFGFGLLEACMQLKSNPETPVLFVYSDEPAPPVYGVSNEAFDAHAIAILLSNEPLIKITCEMAAAETARDLNPQSYAFLDCLNGKNTMWGGEGRIWTWSQHES